MASGSLNTTKDKNSYPPWDEFNLIIHLMQNFLDILGFENTGPGTPGQAAPTLWGAPVVTTRMEGGKDDA